MVAAVEGVPGVPECFECGEADVHRADQTRRATADVDFNFLVCTVYGTALVQVHTLLYITIHYCYERLGEAGAETSVVPCLHRTHLIKSRSNNSNQWSEDKHAHWHHAHTSAFHNVCIRSCTFKPPHPPSPPSLDSTINQSVSGA